MAEVDLCDSSVIEDLAALMAEVDLCDSSDTEDMAPPADGQDKWWCPYKGCKASFRSLHALKAHHPRCHRGLLLDESRVRGPGAVRAEFLLEREKAGRRTDRACNLQVGEEELEQVSSFPYLGSIIAENGGLTEEMRARIQKAGHRYRSLKRPLWSKSGVSLKRKGQVFNASVVSILLYGAEAWALPKAGMRRLETFHQRCLRAITRMPRILHHSNVDVLEAVSCQEAQALVRGRRLRWLGHMRRMDKDRWPSRMLGAVLPGKRRVGGLKACWETVVREDCNRMECEDPWEACLDRVAWRGICGRKLTCGQK